MNIKNIKNKVWSSASRVIDRIARRSSVFRETERRLFQVQYRADRIEVENRELAERTAAIGRRLCEVSVQRPPDSRRRLRVVIEIDHMILERGFLHGDDATVIDHIGRYIGSVAASDIRRANFQRWEM